MGADFLLHYALHIGVIQHTEPHEIQGGFPTFGDSPDVGSCVQEKFFRQNGDTRNFGGANVVIPS